ncbi:glycosyltransferase family 4 protein [Paraburkholderia xenovorans]
MKDLSNANTPRTIIQLGPSRSAHGGIASVLAGYASYESGFEELGYRFIFIASYGEAGRNGILTFIAAWWRLIVLSLFGDVRLVHIHSATRGSLLRKALFALTCMALRRTYVMHIHNGAFAAYYKGMSWPARAIVRLVLANAASLICLSTHAREQFIAMGLAIADKCQLVYNGIDDPLVENQVSSRPSQALAVTFLGKLCEAKGIFTLLEALALLPRSTPAYKLFVGGTGDAEVFQKWVSRYGLGDQVIYLGWIDGDNKNNLLRNTDIFVLPSLSEGFSVAILEAMAFGTAVVSTRIPGVVDAVRQGQDGLLVEPKEVEALRDAILYLLSAAAERDRFGASARQRFLEQFTIRRMACRLARVYEEAMQ